MAKINRMAVAEKYVEIHKENGWATPELSQFDSDDMIDQFGRLMKAGVTEDMMFDVLEGVVNDHTWIPIDDFTDPKWIKKAYKELKKDAPVEKIVEREVVTPIVEKVEVQPIEIDTNAVLGAMGQAIGESLTGQYAPLIAEKALPLVIEEIAKKYDIKKQKVTVEIPDRGKKTGIFHEKFTRVLKYLLKKKNVLLVGDAGTGKNVIAEQCAEAMDIPFYFANKVSDEFQIKGFVDANGNYQATAFYEAFKNGGLFMLDEMDASDGNALDVLNSVLANGYLTFPNGEFVRAHEDFRCIAGANTYGKGATYQYVSRNQLDDATLNRFMQVKIDYSPTIEESLTDDADLLAFIREFRKLCKEYGINHVVSYRNIINLDDMVDDVGIDAAMEDGLIQNLERDDLTMLLDKFSNGWSSNRWAMALIRCMS